MLPILYRVETGRDDLGPIAITSRPRGEPNLAASVAHWRQEGIDIVVSLLATEEAAMVGLAGERDACVAAGIEFVNLPVQDFGVPSSYGLWLPAVTRLADQLQRGSSIATHCYAGLGRSPTLAACVLVKAGLPAEDAIDRLSAARGCPVPERATQHAWILAFERIVRRESGGR